MGSLCEVLESKATISILTATQASFLENFYADEHGAGPFYLSGGTALAEFYLQHRRSDDLDFFTRDRGSLRDVNDRVRAAVRASGLEIRDLTNSDFSIRYYLTGDVERDHPLEKVEFMFDRDPYFAAPVRFGRIHVDAELSIAVNKVVTIAQRTERKDYVDLYLLTRSRYRVDNLLPLAKEKDGLDELGLAAKFDEVDDLMPLEEFQNKYMLVDIRPEEFVSFYKDQARRLFELFPPRHG